MGKNDLVFFFFEYNTGVYYNMRTFLYKLLFNAGFIFTRVWIIIVKYVVIYWKTYYGNIAARVSFVGRSNTKAKGDGGFSRIERESVYLFFSCSSYPFIVFPFVCTVIVSFCSYTITTRTYVRRQRVCANVDHVARDTLPVTGHRSDCDYPINSRRWVRT